MLTLFPTPYSFVTATNPSKTPYHFLFSPPSLCFLLPQMISFLLSFIWSGAHIIDTNYGGQFWRTLALVFPLWGCPPELPTVVGIYDVSSSGGPWPWFSRSGAVLLAVNCKLALAKSICQRLNNNKGNCHLPPWRLNPGLRQLPTFNSPWGESGGTGLYIVRYFQELVSWS